MGNQHNNLNRRGLAVVEMAIVLILLAMIVFGILEYGWAFTRSGQVVNATRNGARLAVLPDAVWPVVKQKIRTQLTNAGFLDSDIKIRDVDINVPRGEAVTIEVEIDPYRSLTGLSPIIPLPKKLRAQVTMAKEGPA